MADSQRAVTEPVHRTGFQKAEPVPTCQSESPIFRRKIEPTVLRSIGPSAKEMLRTFEHTIPGPKSNALLIWPQPSDSVAVFHAVAALNRLPDCDTTGLATLFFPWSRHSGAIQRTLLLDRDFVYEATLPALNRVMATSAKHPVFGYLMALHSLKHILASGKKDKRFKKALEIDPGLFHPTLFEIMPQHGVQDARLQSYDGCFLRRLRRHTWIDERKSHIDAAADPSRTPFYFFGVHADAIGLQQFRVAGLDPQHDGRRPDVVLIDLTRHARGRLSNNWHQRLSRFLGIVGELYATDSPPALAVTDDVFVLQKLRWEILTKYDVSRGLDTSHRRPASSRIVLNPKSDLFDPETFTAGPVFEITAEAYGSDILSVVELGLKLRRLLLDAGDSEIANAVAAAIESVQNVVSLPGPSRQFFDFLADNYDGYELQSLGSRFDAIGPSGRMKIAVEQGLGGANQGRLSEFLHAFERTYANAITENPGRTLFDTFIQGLARKATGSIVVFSSEALRSFAEWRIETDSALSDVRPSLGRELRLVDRREAVEELELDHREKRLFKQIVFVEPEAEDLLRLMACPWLPEKVLVLANLVRIEHALRRIRALLLVDGIGPVRSHLVAARQEFDRVLVGRVVDVPDLEIAPSLPRLGTLDLTVASTSDSGQPRIIATSDDLRIRAFDGSEVALYDPEALQVFSRKLAKDVKPGDQICVLSPDFVGMAREKLNLTADASEVLPLYHGAIVEAARKLPGDDVTSKTTALREKMLKIEPALDLPGIQAMRHWIDVESLVDRPRNEVRPQAPRDRRHYLCFMRALGISLELARQYWDWGIFWTRSMRIRSGAAFHQVFMGILVDPRGTVSRLPESRRRDVWRIYETAEHHVVTVISNREEEQ